MFSYMVATLVARARRGAGDELLGEDTRRAGQPAVDQGLAKGALTDDLQLDQHGGVAVEVRDREEAFLVCREHGLLLAEIVDPHGKDRACGGRFGAEPLDVRLAERTLPREALARNRP